MKSMKIQRILIVLVALIILSMSVIVIAQANSSNSVTRNRETTSNEVILHELSVTFDNVRLMVASISGPSAHSELAITLAEKRVIEIKQMANEGNIQGMRRSLDQYKKLMGIVRGRSQDIVKINSTNTITLQIELSQSLSEHRRFVNNVSNTLIINIKNNENIDENEREQIFSLLKEMRQSIEIIESELRDLRNRTKENIVRQTNKELKDVNITVGMIKREQGFTELRNRVQQTILKAITESMTLNKIINALEVSDPYILNTSSNAQNELRLARISYDAGDYNAAINHASMSVILFEILFENLDRIKEVKFNECTGNFEMRELAQKEINSTTSEIIYANSKKIERNITNEIILNSLNIANAKLIEAKTAFNNGNYLKAYIYAIESKRLADSINVKFDVLMIESMLIDGKSDISEKSFNARYEILSTTKEFNEVRTIVNAMNNSYELQYLLKWAENRLNLSKDSHSNGFFAESLIHSTTAKRMLEIITEKIEYME